MTVSSERPLPAADPLMQGFWDHARSGRLSVQECIACGSLHFPASPVCPECLSDRQRWTAVSGIGRVESWVEFHHAYWPGLASELPYRVCLVKLREGPLLISNPAGAVEIGDEVEAVFEPITPAISLPKFRRAGRR